MKIKQKILVCVEIILALTIAIGTASATVTVDSLTKLTDNPYGDSFPDWSPNDDKLIYLEYSSDWWSASRICEMNSDGNYKNEVIPQSAWQPKCSPDGTKIAYASGTFGGDLALKNVITGSVEILVPTHGDYQGLYPNWSPDGKKIVYSKYHEPSDPAQIWIYDLESKTNTKISTDNTDERYPAWSPDGKYISYVRDGQDIWMMDYQEGTKTPITNTPNFEKGVHSWSPDSSMIVYTSNEYGNNDLFIINIDGSGKTRLTTSSSGDAHPDWSHNGDKIAFSSNKDGNYDIWVMELNFNQPPAADVNGPCVSYEGATITFDASGSSDPDGDDLTYRWDFDGDGSWDTEWSSEATATYTWNDDYIGDVVVEVSDGELTDTATTTVTVNNVAPEITSIDLPDAPVEIGFSVDLSAEFTDGGILDTHTYEIDWDVNSVEDILSRDDASDGIIEASHTYLEAGVYTIKLTVTDDDGGIATVISDYVVVYDPEGGFVTGGGWIDSLAGYYLRDETLAGKATFGFVSKYKNGATVPTGNTEFQFQVADLNFKSTSYEWLVIAGSKAKYKGVGTINGEGEYAFMLSAIDSDDGDKFRMKIWNEDGVIYDNQGEDSDDADASTVIAGGSIVVHKEK